jgi:amino acid adenylation domain-containing protein
MALHHVLETGVQGQGARGAIIEGQGTGRIDYTHFIRLTDQLRDRLVAMGIGRGDRVGLYVHKSIDGLAAIFGILKAGAAYVPVDPTAPASRNASIHHHCGVKLVIIETCFTHAYRESWARLGAQPPLFVLDAVGGGGPLTTALEALTVRSPAPSAMTVASAPDDLAYILYTSGSTGQPKGVMLSHRNALAFVDWCTETFAPRASDVFSAHAPWHFDLSIFDIYVSLKHGATLVLIPENIGKEPRGLAQLLATQRISIWYSTPAVLSLLAQFGQLTTHDLSSLRLILFAGEVFPVVSLRTLQRQIPHPRYYNLYGPTETNVCTWYALPAVIPNHRIEAYPIGATCPHLQSRVVDSDGRPVTPGTEGELCIAGANVMAGYWGMSEQTAASFLPDDGTGQRWYKTGDLVIEAPDGIYHYTGRRDRMVKKRGYRIELGEIEACLYRHAALREAAVVAVLDPEAGVQIWAHLSLHAAPRPSLIALKTFCAQHLPLYMVPDVFVFHATLPKTSTGKIDYATLQRYVPSG